MPFTPDQTPVIPDKATSQTGSSFKPDAPSQNPASGAKESYIHSKLAQYLGPSAADTITSIPDMGLAAGRGVIKGASLSNVDIGKIPYLGPGYMKASEEHPTVTAGAEAIGSLLPGFVVGGGVGALLPELSGVAGVASRVAGNAAGGAVLGGLQNPGDNGSRVDNAVQGAKAGGVLGAAGEAVSGLANMGRWAGKGLSKFTDGQADAYLQDPADVARISKQLKSPTPELQDEARQALQTSIGNLREGGINASKEVGQALQGKSFEVDPTQYKGLDPRVDEILDRASKAGDVYGVARVAPDKVNLSGEDTNKLKTYLQQTADFVNQNATDVAAKARSPEIAQKAYGLRQQIEQAVPGVREANKISADSFPMQRQLQGGLTNPISFISSESPDRIANLARVEKAGGGGLLDLGNKIGAAKEMALPDSVSGVPAFGLKLGGRSLLRASDAIKDANDPAVVQALLSGINSGK